MRAGLRRTVVPALHTLRAYRSTAVLLIVAGAAVLAALLPVSALVAPPGTGFLTRLGLAPVRGSDIALALGTMARSPMATRETALLALFRLLLGVASGVLVVGWLTTLALAAARAVGRRTEIVVRRAVGASRRHLLASELIEGGALATAAVLVGGALGLAAARLAAAAWPGSLGAVTAGPSLAAAAATVAAIVLGALLPLLFARRGAPIADAGAATLGLVLPAAQLGLSLTVLAAAALLHRAADPVAAERGRSAGGEVYQIGAAATKPAARAAAYRSLLLRLRADSTVAAASLSSPGTLAGLGPIDNASTDCGDCVWGQLALPWHQVRATHYLVSADTFRTLGIPVIAGRAFSDDDRWDTARVAVVNRTLAAWHFQHGDAVGRLIRVGHGPDALYTVVGVVEDRRPMAFGAGLEPPYSIYLSVLQHPAPAVDLLVRGGGGRSSRVPVNRALRRAFGGAAGPVVPVSQSQLLAAETRPLRWFATMLASEGWAMLAIATAGAFAMMWLWVASLATELGLRRSVGARRSDVLRYVLARAAVVAAGGVAFGCWSGMMAWDALRSAVAGLPAWDLGAVLRIALLLAAATLVGALLPAWRAARASPAALAAS
jgi:putative ABC transport system permease protein